LRAVELFTILGTFLGAFYTAVAAFEQRLIKKLKKENAFSAKNAVEIPKLLPVTRLWINRLKRACVVKELKSGRIYFREPEYRAFIKKRVWSVLIFIVSCAILIMAFHI